MAVIKDLVNDQEQTGILSQGNTWIHELIYLTTNKSQDFQGLENPKLTDIVKNLVFSFSYACIFTGNLVISASNFEKCP